MDPRHRKHACNAAAVLEIPFSDFRFSGIGMACSVRALEFAHRRLAALSVMSGLEAAEVYDCMLGRLRHALLLVHCFVPRDQAQALMPLLDLLTSLQVGSSEPVGTGTVAQRGDSIRAAAPRGSAMDAEIGALTQILRELGEDRGMPVRLLQEDVCEC